MMFRFIRFLIIALTLGRIKWIMRLTWVWRLVVFLGLTGWFSKKIRHAIGLDKSRTSDVDSAWAEALRYTPAAASAGATASSAAQVKSSGTSNVDIPASESTSEAVGYSTDGSTETVTVHEMSTQGETETIVAEELAAEAEIAEILDTLEAGEPEVEIVEEVLAAPTIDPDWVRAEGSHDCPASHPVKGKASSMIYYVPESGHYDRTIPDVCFAAEADAEAAGYRAPRR